MVRLVRMQQCRVLSDLMFAVVTAVCVTTHARVSLWCAAQPTEAMCKIFDEILLNAADNNQRNTKAVKMTYIKVCVASLLVVHSH